MYPLPEVDKKYSLQQAACRLFLQSYQLQSVLEETKRTGSDLTEKKFNDFKIFDSVRIFTYNLFHKMIRTKDDAIYKRSCYPFINCI